MGATTMQFPDKIPQRVAATAGRLDDLLKSWGWFGVLVFAILYYSRYYRSGLNLGGEGGTVAVYAMRLMEGYRPMVDTFLGYNVMWFYPVSWLFELTGPDYIALRLFFFGLCTCTGLMAFFITRRVTGSGWYSVLVALGPVLIPGMLFRNYMAFLAVLNMLTLLQAYVFEQPTSRRRIFWMAAAGFSLGLTYLVRIDLGGFFSVITLGLLVLYPLGSRGEFTLRLKRAGVGVMLTIVMFSATHAPFYIDAVRRGYDRPFVDQYIGWLGLVRYLAAQQVAQPPPILQPTPAVVPVEPPSASVPVSQDGAMETTEVPAKKSSGDLDSSEYLQKRSLAGLWVSQSGEERVFTLVTYLPIPLALLIVLPFGSILLIALISRRFALRTEALAVLVATGAALTLFPQYFFFRPDTPHLSEFMAPFFVGVGAAVWTAWRWSRYHWAAMAYAVLLTILSVADVSLYLTHAYPKESAGTVAARRKRNHELVAENNVRVMLKQKERDELAEFCRLVKEHTKPGDYLVTYPYSPTVNFMTDRPSFEYNLYVDNAHNVSRFHEETMEEFGKYRPAAIVIDNRAVNQTEDSRFKNWAAETYKWIGDNYIYAGTFRRQELYLRSDLYTASPQTPANPPTSNLP